VSEEAAAIAGQLPGLRNMTSMAAAHSQSFDLEGNQAAHGNAVQFSVIGDYM
jgi:hypothetical protein